MVGLNHSPRIVTDGLVLALDAGNQKSLPVSSSSTFSNYFDGSSDWLNVGASSATQLTGDFTVEAWVWIDSTVVASRPDNFKTVSLFSSGGATSGTCLFAIAGNTSTAGTGLEIYQDSPFSSLYVTTPFPLDQWAHVAFVRTGSTVYGFINGTRHTLTVGAGATNTLGSSSSGSRIGSILNSTYYGYWKGFISNFRVLKGTALYTANFTPSTTPFTAITNTSLLTCQSATFIDNSTNNLSITTNGNVTAQAATLTFFSTNTWVDLSGNNNNGTTVNSPTFSSSGFFTFNGTSQRVGCGNASNLQITVGSISAWFSADNTNSGYNGIITKQSAWGLFVKDNVLVAYDWGNNVERTTGITVGNNSWNHVVMTFTETVGTPSNNAKIYLNGREVLTTTIKHSLQSVEVQIGDGGISNQFFGGKIAAVSIYNRVLTATEVLQNFNALRGRFSI